MALAKPKRLTTEYYRKLPEGAPYQLIEGELIMTPAPGPRHQIILGRLFTRLSEFVERNALGIVLLSPVDVYLDEENAFQPDIIFISQQRRDIIKSDGVYGPPDIAVEILSPSTAAYDLREKFQVYQRAGVKEYWVVDPEGNSVTQYTNKSGQFFLISKTGSQEEITSSVLEGLKIASAEIFRE